MNDLVNSILTATGGAAINSVFKGPAETLNQCIIILDIVWI